MIVTPKELENSEYQIVKTFKKPILSFSEVLDDMINNTYSGLENYSKENFFFIKFKDEEIIIENKQKEQFIVFGKYNEGVFVISKNQEVLLIQKEYSGLKEPIFVNSSLIKFVRCYCLLLSVFFSYKSKNFSSYKAKKFAKKFQKEIKRIDCKALDSLFYKNYSYFIEELELPIHYNPMTYVNSGRHFIST